MQNYCATFNYVTVIETTLGSCWSMDLHIADRAAREIINIRDRARVMLLGTFHFDSPGMDELNLNVDMTTEQRQTEIEEVVHLLEAFRPTKIAVEAPLEAKEKLNERLSAYQSGELRLPANEVYQLGFRLASRLGHKAVFPIDAWARQCYSEESFVAYLREIGIDEDAFRNQVNEREWWDRYTRLHEHNQRLAAALPLRDYLAYLNSEEQIRLSHGIYLAWPDADSGNYRVADFITGWWYNRNLRIYANLKRITESPEDRILVIYGSGHIPILRHCVETSYLHTLEPVMTYLLPSS
jgi:hypothetical protein